MTKDIMWTKDIMRMAEESGVLMRMAIKPDATREDLLVRFAEMIAEAVREQDEKVCT